MKDFKGKAHEKWECKYHVVILPKYRKKVLYGKLRREIGSILRELCLYKGIKLEEGKAMAIGYLKVKSAIRIHRGLMKMKGTLFDRSFWSRGYFVSTVGLAEAEIRQYIIEQEKSQKDQIEFDFD